MGVLNVNKPFNKVDTAFFLLTRIYQGEDGVEDVRENASFVV